MVTSRARPHPKLWFEDGSLLLRAQDDLYKVHRTLLHRHSSILPSLTSSIDRHGDSASTSDGTPIVDVPEGVQSGDLEMLLEHLYHDV